MAIMPRYTSSDIAVGTPQGQLRDVSAPFDQLSTQMNRMTSFYLQEAEQQAVIEGQKYGAETAPSAEQLVEAYKSGTPLETTTDATTVFGRAAMKAQQEVVRTNMYYASHAELTKIANQIELGQLSPDAGLKSMNAMIDGFSGAVQQIDPVESQKIKAELAYKANTHYLSATKRLASNSIKEAQVATAKEIDARTQSISAILAAGDRYDPTSGKITSVNELIALEYAKVDQLGSKISRPIREQALQNFQKVLVDARKDYVTNIALSFATDEDRESYLKTLNDYKTGKSTGNKTLDSVLGSMQPDQFVSAIKTVRELNTFAEADNKRLYDAEEAKKKAAYNVTRNDLFTRLTNMEAGDLSNPLTIADIQSANLPTFGEGSKETFRILLNNINKKDTKPDATAYLEITTDIQSGKITSTDQLEPYVRSAKIGISEINTLRTLIDNPDKLETKQITQFINSAKNVIIGKNEFGVEDPLAQDQFLAFTYQFDKKYKEGIAKGLTPNQLLDPTQNTSLWPMVGTYKRSLSEIIKSQAAEMMRNSGKAAEIPSLTQDEIAKLPSGQKIKFIAKDDPTKTVRTKP